MTMITSLIKWQVSVVAMGPVDARAHKGDDFPVVLAVSVPVKEAWQLIGS